MQDKPCGDDILAEVEKALRDGLAPGLAQRMAANAVALARREDLLAAEFAEAERVRLAELLGRRAPLAALNRDLATAIRGGMLRHDDPALIAHLRRTTVEKLTVDQPTYPPFQASQNDRT